MKRESRNTLSAFTIMCILTLALTGCTASDPEGARPTTSDVPSVSSAPSPSPTASATPTFSPEDGVAYDTWAIDSTLQKFSQGVGVGVFLRKTGNKEALEGDDSYLRKMVDPSLSDAKSHTVVENMAKLMAEQDERETKAYGLSVSNDPLLSIPADKIAFEGNAATVSMSNMNVLAPHDKIEDAKWSGSNGSITFVKHEDKKWYISKVTIPQ